jgi:hypothetical protein
MAKGVYIQMAHHPQQILDTLAQAERDAQGDRQEWKLGCGLTAGLAALGALAFFVGSNLGFPILRIVAFVLWAIAIIVAIVLLLSRPRFAFQQFEPARQILHTLRDDTGRKGYVVGWLDMTGPTQKEKQTRTARSGGGKQKVYYHDPWFQAKLKLVDGNVLRLYLLDKVKTKAGSVVNHRTQFTAKLIVNPALYRVSPASAGGADSPIPITSEGNGLLTIKTEIDMRQVPVDQLLKSLKTLYTYLEVIGPEQPNNQPTNQPTN